VRAASSPHRKSKTANDTGRHRAPARFHRNLKIIAVAAPAVALVGAFVAYQAQPSGSNPVANSVASYHQRTLPAGAGVADGSGTPLTTHPASGSKSHTATASSKAATTPKAQRSAKAQSPRHASNAPQSPVQAPSSPAPSPTPTSSGSGSGSLKADVQNDIANGNYLLAVGQYLVENGYSKAAAAGVASCVDGESGGNPESVGTGGGGLIGWTPISSAAPNSNIITGNPSQDMMTQLEDLLYYNSTEIGQEVVAQLDANTDPVAAADFYSQNFEKPAVTDSDVVPSVAEQIYSELGG
jgi:hypothetical protein